MDDHEYRNDPEYWRARAEETRTKAEQMRDPVAKATLNGIADSYEMLATRAARFPKKAD